MFIDLEITVTSGAPENTKAGVFFVNNENKRLPVFILWKEFRVRFGFTLLRFVNKVIIDLILPLFCTKECAIELLTVSVEQNENLPSTRFSTKSRCFCKLLK